MQEKWLKRSKDAHNWEPFFNYYSSLGNKMKTGQEMENELRSKIKRVLPCDVHLTNPLHPFTLEGLDTITTSLCLESASPDVAAYSKALQNVVSLLRPGGKFILIGVLNNPYYTVGDEKFHCLSIQKSDVLNALKKAGLDLLQLFETDIGAEDDFSPFKGGLVVFAEKKK